MKDKEGVRISNEHMSQLTSRILKESATRPVLAPVFLVGVGEQMGFLIWDSAGNIAGGGQSHRKGFHGPRCLRCSRVVVAACGVRISRGAYVGVVTLIAKASLPNSVVI